jgi:hypothetical protein
VAIAVAACRAASQAQRKAKVAHAAAKPSNRAMPTRFTTNLLMLCHFQAQLQTAAVEIE